MTTQVKAKIGAAGSASLCTPYVLNMYLLSKQRWVRVPGVSLVSYFNVGNAPGEFWGDLLAPLLIGVVAGHISIARKVCEYAPLATKKTT